MNRSIIDKVWVDDSHVFAITTDGRQASYAFADWPLLAKATPAQRKNFVLSYSGIHWPEIDEDLSFDGMFRDSGLLPLTSFSEPAVCYVAHSDKD